MRTSFFMNFLRQALVFCLAVCAVPASADMPPSPQALQGVWAGSNGQVNVLFMFTGNNCALSLNGQQVTGIWNLAGDRLNVQFQNGKSLSYSVALQGNDLVLDGNMRLVRQTMPGMADKPTMPGQQGGWGTLPPNFANTSPLEGTWSTRLPQGTRSFRFVGNRYAQLFNGQVVEEGIFQYSPDGRFLYQVTGGQFAGQSGEDRITIYGNSITVVWPDGTVLTFTREPAGTWGGGGTPPPPGIDGGSGVPFGLVTPLEGRWIWAKQAPVSFGYVFSGNRFVFFYNGVERGSGTFSLSAMQLSIHHETGPDAGKTDVLGYRLQGNRLLIFTSDDPNIDPIPFVRQ